MYKVLAVLGHWEGITLCYPNFVEDAVKAPGVPGELAGFLSGSHSSVPDTLRFALACVESIWPKGKDPLSIAWGAWTKGYDQKALEGKPLVFERDLRDRTIRQFEEQAPLLQDAHLAAYFVLKAAQEQEGAQGVQPGNLDSTFRIQAGESLARCFAAKAIEHATWAAEASKVDLDFPTLVRTVRALREVKNNPSSS